jgi:hypothetical protein
MRTLLALLFVVTRLAPCATLISHMGGTNPTTFTTDGAGTHGSPISTVGADTIYAIVAYTVIPPLLTDSRGNTWTNIVSETHGGGGMAQAIYCAASPATSASHTFTLTVTGTSYPLIEVQAWSGASCTVDVFTHGNNTGGATFTVDPITTTANGDIIVQGVTDYTPDLTADSVAVNGDYTISDNITRTNAALGSSAAYLVQAMAGLTHPSWTFIGTPPVSAVYNEVAFKAGASQSVVHHKAVTQ